MHAADSPLLQRVLDMLTGASGLGLKVVGGGGPVMRRNQSMVKWFKTQGVQVEIAFFSFSGHLCSCLFIRASRLRSYTDWVYKNRMKAEAGMIHARNNTAPATPE